MYVYIYIHAHVSYACYNMCIEIYVSYTVHVHICLFTDLAPFSWHCTVRKVRESSCELSGVEIQMASATSLFGAMPCYTLEMNKSKKSKSESHPVLLRRLALDWSL